MDWMDGRMGGWMKRCMDFMVGWMYGFNAGYMSSNKKVQFDLCVMLFS